MKVRIKFQKYGAMKFIGHLDVMRYFQKAFRRAGVDSEYSKGYNPHQIMSFAAPLGVGLTSDGEYVDIELKSSDSPEMMIERMNAAMTEGFCITGFNILKDREENQKNVTAMALVASADYLVSLKDGYEVSERINTPEKFCKEFEQFYSNQEIVIDKKTKKSEKVVDIKPMITLVAFEETEYMEKRNNTLLNSNHQLFEVTDKTVLDNQQDMNSDSKAPESLKVSGLTELSEYTDQITLEAAKPESVADSYANGIRLYLQVDTGSSANLKPELVMEAFCNYLEIEYQSFAWQVHRLEVYTREEESNKLIPLDKLDR